MSQEPADDGQRLSASKSPETSSHDPKLQSGTTFISARTDPQESAGRPSFLTGPSFLDAASSAESTQARKHSGMDAPSSSRRDIGADSANPTSESREYSVFQCTDGESQQQLYPSDRVLDELLDEAAPLHSNAGSKSGVAERVVGPNGGARTETFSGPSQELRKQNASLDVLMESQTEDPTKRSEQLAFVPNFELFREHDGGGASSSKPGPSGSYQSPQSHQHPTYHTPLYDPFTYPHDRSDIAPGQLELKHINDPFNYRASHPHHHMHPHPAVRTSYDRDDLFNQSYHPDQPGRFGVHQHGGHPYGSLQTQSSPRSSRHNQPAPAPVVLKDKDLLHRSDVLRGSGERIREHLWRGRAVPPAGSEEVVVPRHHPPHSGADVPEWDEEAAAARREIDARARNRRRRLMEKDGLFRGNALQKVMAEEEQRKQDVARCVVCVLTCINFGVPGCSETLMIGTCVALNVCCCSERDLKMPCTDLGPHLKPLH